MADEQYGLKTRLTNAIESDERATTVDEITQRVCQNERGDTGIEFKIRGEYVTIKPIIDVFSDSGFVIDEFGLGADTDGVSLYVFVYDELYGSERTWSDTE
jgi:hypothetical protein